MQYALLDAYYNSPEYLQKLRARAENLKAAEQDPLQRSRLIMEVWAVDPVAFIEDFCFIKIPEYQNAIKPFFTLEYQRDIIYKLQQAEQSGLDVELLIDKPRGMGITWIFAAYMYWRWLFTPNWSGFVLSRTEIEVDDGTDSPDNSIFGKFRFLIKHTPKWMLPEGYTSKGKKGTSTDSTLRILNPAMGSSLVGSSTNANAGRSRRYSFIFIDECFSIERFNELWRSLQSVARVKAFVSTVKPGRVFEDFKKMCEKDNNYLSLTWKQHPFKDQLWYEDQLRKAEFDPEVMKEVEPSYAVSLRSQYYPEIRQASYEPLTYDRQKPLYMFLDFGRQDFTVLGWMQFDGLKLRILECYANKLRPLGWYAPFMNPELPYDLESYNEYQRRLLDRVRSWNKPNAYFGEQAHFKKEMASNQSIADILFRDYKVRLMYNQYAIHYEPRRIATALMLPRCVFNWDSDGVKDLYDALANSRYVNTVAPTSKNSTLKPVHDTGIADYRAAFENGMVNIGRVIRRQREDVQPDLNSSRTVGSLIKYLKI